MSRGRKPKTENANLNWRQLYKKNAGVYFQIIVQELGKLNIQSNDNAKELLIKIISEKEKVRKSVIKLPEIKLDEIPYQIPDNWIWCRLGQITDYGSSFKANPSDLDDNIWVLDLEDIEKTTSVLINKVRFKDRNSLSTKSVFKKGDVLYSKLRPYLDKVIVADEDGVCTTEILPLTCFGEINPYFFMYMLKRMDFINYVNSITKGMKMPRLGTKEGQNALLPLAPISEQNIIMEFLTDLEYETLIPEKIYFNSLIEQKIIEIHNSQLIASELQNLLSDQLTQIENLNQAILQEAVQGKLVKQDPKDEPASQLLKRIKAEKLTLRQVQGKGKKEKPLPPINLEEIPFEIPENWVWCRLGEVSNIVRGGSPRPAGDKTYYDGNIPFLKVGDLTDGNDVYLYKHTFTIKDAGLYKTRFVEANTLMLTNSGATLGYPKICTFPTTFNDGIAAFLDLSDDFDKVYLFYFLKSLTNWFLKEASRGQGQPNLNTDIIGYTPFPIPPKEEQKRIVAEIEKQLAKTKQLKEHIIANQQATEQLLKALLHGAFEVEEKKKYNYENQ